MKLISSIRSSVRTLMERSVAKKEATARHRLESAATVVAIVAEQPREAVTQVLPKYMGMVADLRRVIKDLRHDAAWLEGRASTCAFNHPFEYTDRITGHRFMIASYEQAEPHLRRLTKSIRKMQDTLNVFDPHPDYKVMRRGSKVQTRTAA